MNLHISGVWFSLEFPAENEVFPTLCRNLITEAETFKQYLEI